MSWYKQPGIFICSFHLMVIIKPLVRATVALLKYCDCLIYYTVFFLLIKFSRITKQQQFSGFVITGYKILFSGEVSEEVGSVIWFCRCKQTGKRSNKGHDDLKWSLPNWKSVRYSDEKLITFNSPGRVITKKYPAC